jgi:RNA polymerase sigma-70 factor (ECF subfamily)
MIQQQAAETSHDIKAPEPSQASLNGTSIVAFKHGIGAFPLSGDIGPLLSRVASEDPAAFAELYRLTGGKLFNIALLILKRRDLAEQIVQLSYAMIWRDAARFDGSRGLPIDWMIAIVRKLAIGHLRSADMDLIPPRDGLPHPELVATPQAAPDKLSLPREPEPDRHLILATAYLHGESREQLSQRLGLSVEAVKALLRKALLELHRAPE